MAIIDFKVAVLGLQTVNYLMELGIGAHLRDGNRFIADMIVAGMLQGRKVKWISEWVISNRQQYYRLSTSGLSGNNHVKSK